MNVHTYYLHTNVLTFVCILFVVVKEYDTLSKSSRIVSADALTGKSHDPASCSHTEPTVPRHHSAGEHTCGTASGVKRSPSSPKDKVTAHWNSNILPLLNQLHPSVQDSREVCRLLDLLWEKLSGGDYLGRSGGVGGTKKRSAVLKAVFVLLDSKDPQLLLKVAKILLAVSHFVLSAFTYVRMYNTYVRIYVRMYLYTNITFQHRDVHMNVRTYIDW